MQVFVAYGAVSSTLDYTSKGSWGQHQTDLWFGVWIQSVTPGTQAAHWHLSSMKSDSRHVPSAILWRGLRPTRVDGYRARAAVSTLTEGLLFLFIFYKLLRWIQWDNETTLPVQPTYIICTHMYTQAHIQPSSALHGVVHQRQAAGFLFPLFNSSTKPVTSLWRRDARNLILLCLRNHPLCACVWKGRDSHCCSDGVLSTGRCFPADWILSGAITPTCQDSKNRTDTNHCGNKSIPAFPKEEHFCKFTSVHHHSGLGIKQSRCD